MLRLGRLCLRELRRPRRRLQLLRLLWLLGLWRLLRRLLETFRRLRHWPRLHPQLRRLGSRRRHRLRPWRLSLRWLRLRWLNLRRLRLPLRNRDRLRPERLLRRSRLRRIALRRSRHSLGIAWLRRDWHRLRRRAGRARHLWRVTRNLSRRRNDGAWLRRPASDSRCVLRTLRRWGRARPAWVVCHTVSP